MTTKPTILITPTSTPSKAQKGTEDETPRHTGGKSPVAFLEPAVKRKAKKPRECYGRYAQLVEISDRDGIPEFHFYEIPMSKLNNEETLKTFFKTRGSPSPHGEARKTALTILQSVKKGEIPGFVPVTELVAAEHSLTTIITTSNDSN